jgi:hypothetical protein
VAKPGYFNKQAVRVNAYVYSDRHHFVVLLDRESDQQGIALVVPEVLRDDPRVRALILEIYAPPKRAEKYHIMGTFTGMFEWHPGKVPSRVLLLKDLAGLKKVKAEH